MVKGTYPQPFTRYAVPATGKVPVVTDFALTYKETIERAISTTGRVHPRKFWRLPALGDTRVFTGGREYTSRLRASVALLWDFSSSQSGFRDALVYSLAIVGSSLSRVGLAVWAGAYTNGGNEVSIFEACGWNDRWDHRRATALEDVSMGGTPTGEALTYLRSVIIPKAPLPRHLVVVCTDGAPNDTALTVAEIKRLQAMRVIVAGIYVGGNPDSAMRSLSEQFGRRNSFTAARREDIPVAVNRILGRLVRV